MKSAHEIELEQEVERLRQELNQHKVSAGKSAYPISIQEQLERLPDDDPTARLTIYEVNDAPYLVIGEAVYKRLKQRADKRYHIVRYDGSDGYLLLSDITRSALKFDIRSLGCHITNSEPDPSTIVKGTLVDQSVVEAETDYF